MATKKIVVEIEVPEGVRIEDLLRGLRYRIIEPERELESILKRAREKGGKISKIPSREEIYAERTRY